MLAGFIHSSPLRPKSTVSLPWILHLPLDRIGISFWWFTELLLCWWLDRSPMLDRLFVKFPLDGDLFWLYERRALEFKRCFEVDASWDSKVAAVCGIEPILLRCIDELLLYFRSACSYDCWSSCLVWIGLRCLIWDWEIRIGFWINELSMGVYFLARI